MFKNLLKLSISLCLLFTACGGGGSHDDDNNLPINDDTIPDFSGVWNGKLQLRSNDCQLNLDSSINFTMKVEQNGTAIKVDDGDRETFGELNPERNGFYSQASGKSPETDYPYKWSHSLRLAEDNNYIMQLSITFQTTDGISDFNCNYKYLGVVTKQ